MECIFWYEAGLDFAEAILGRYAMMVDGYLLLCTKHSVILSAYTNDHTDFEINSTGI